MESEIQCLVRSCKRKWLVSVHDRSRKGFFSLFLFFSSFFVMILKNKKLFRNPIRAVRPRCVGFNSLWVGYKLSIFFGFQNLKDTNHFQRKRMREWRERVGRRDRETDRRIQSNRQTVRKLTIQSTLSRAKIILETSHTTSSQLPPPSSPCPLQPCQPTQQPLSTILTLPILCYSPRPWQTRPSTYRRPQRHKEVTLRGQGSRQGRNLERLLGCSRARSRWGGGSVRGFQGQLLVSTVFFLKYDQLFL